MSTSAPSSRRPLCHHRTILISNLKKKFLNAKPGQAGPRKSIVDAFEGATNCVVFYRSRTCLVEFASVEEADSALLAYCPAAGEEPTDDGDAGGGTTADGCEGDGAAGATCAILSTLVLGGAPASMAPADQPFKPERAFNSRTNETIVARACSNCISNLLKQVQKREDAENRIRRRLETQRHRQLLRELAKQSAAVTAGGHDGDGVSSAPGADGDGQPQRQIIRTDVCYDFVKRAGRQGACSRGEECPFKHELVPLNQIPAHLRHYTIRDSFPEARESHAEKLAVNTALAAAASHMANPRCIVLDGAGCGTTSALQALHRGAPHTRGQHDVVVPNSCTETYLAIHNLRKCLAYHGSLRAYLDENAAVRLRQHPSARLKGEAKAPQLAKHFRPSVHFAFGLVYLDYCATLYAGYDDIEKSPIEDIRALFRTGTLDPDGAVLAVTLALPPPKTDRGSNGPTGNNGGADGGADAVRAGAGAGEAAGEAAGAVSNVAAPAMHGRHGKDAAGQESDLCTLVAEAATDAQRVAVRIQEFNYERTSIYIFVCYHAAEEEGVAACRQWQRPLSVAEALAAAPVDCSIPVLLRCFK